MIKFVRIASFLLAAVITVFSIFFIDAEQELAQAQLAYRSGDMDQALRKARRANRAFSTDEKKVSAYYVQARAAAKMNWTEKAKDYLDELLSIDQDNMSGLLFRGEIELQLGHNENALRDLNKGIALASENLKPNDLAYSLSKRGLVHLNLNQTNEAEKDAQKALQLSANLPEAHDLMSKVLEEKGEIKKALAECERAYQLSIEKNKLSFMTPEGQKLSNRLVDLRVKALRTK
ncbi:MAG TPA: tetratricopeptide repeat protein [Draconibacterium sp.]|nr:tetratricopeptide repeat protein [Draconibacterium sp.]